ncbi:pyridoxal phosphate homeostasis protein [Nephila pilipes]|uniref:Pyridoxal phosphate homeostasis protein n=1 Tax=Nephila pilipes TaxID=299642 RepID=A0A8X6MMV8_NEPPI|nr:pyridoxal phosphate homeostasis protein [Nephila pilipes]
MSEHQFSIAENLEKIRNEMEAAISRRPKEMTDDVILVAVSKRKSKDCVIEAYNNGVRYFGENYAHELFDKSNDPNIVNLCPDIKWTFIGHLQKNKVTKLIYGCPNLNMIQTIDSIKLAEVVENTFANKTHRAEEYMDIMIQVNTSGEESKSGVPVQDVEEMYLFVKENCPNLVVKGLMTIGSPNHDLGKGPNPDFVALVKLKKMIKDKYDDELGLSMGMSQDFQHAIELGTQYIRVGERIFGKRN